MSLAEKGMHVVVRCFVCGDNDTILMETGKFSDNIRVTEIGLVSGVDRVLLSLNSIFITSAIDLIHHSERVSTSNSSLLTPWKPYIQSHRFFCIRSAVQP